MKKLYNVYINLFVLNKKMESKFKDALKTCSEEAFLIIKENPNMDFSMLLLNATLNTFDHCSDCDCEHEEFLFKLIKLSKQKYEIENFLLDNLTNNNSISLGVFSLFKIAKMMFFEGNVNAKYSIYNRYTKNLLEDFPFIDTYVPIEIDGYDGLKFISEVKGRFFIENNYFWEDNKIIDVINKTYPKNNFLDRLLRESVNNKYIKEFVTKGLGKEILIYTHY